MWIAIAAASPQGEWVDHLRAVGLNPYVALECQPLDRALERAPGIPDGTRFVDALPVDPDLWDIWRSAEGRARLGLAANGPVRVAVSDHGVAMQLGFRGGAAEAQALLAAIRGVPSTRAKWEGQRLVSLDGKAPADIAASFAAGTFELHTTPTRAVVEGPVVDLLAAAPKTQQGCVLTLDPARLASEGRAGLPRAVSFEFPFEAGGAVRVRAVAHAPARPLTIPESMTPAVGRSVTEPRSVGVFSAPLGAFSPPALLPEADTALVAEAAALPGLAQFAGTTWATFGDDITAVVVPADQIAGMPATEKALAKWMKGQLKGAGYSVGGAGAGMLKIQRAGQPFRYVAVRPRQLVFSDSLDIAGQIAEGRGDRWLSEGEQTLAARFPFVVSFRDSPRQPRMAIGVVHRGDERWDAVIVRPPDQGIAALLRALDLAPSPP